MEVSRGTVLQSLEPLQQKAQAWLTRPLEGEYWALYIDAMNVHTRRRDSVELEPLLFVVGVWTLQLAWSKPWLALFCFGPVEWLWGCLTAGVFKNNRRVPVVSMPG